MKAGKRAIFDRLSLAFSKVEQNANNHFKVIDELKLKAN